MKASAASKLDKVGYAVWKKVNLAMGEPLSEKRLEPRNTQNTRKGPDTNLTDRRGILDGDLPMGCGCKMAALNWTAKQLNMGAPGSLADLLRKKRNGIKNMRLCGTDPFS